ncbi:hypothetical protein EJ08DRAFT_1892 [Tothia fuscella]|uniref:BTB domain-containing protein n=1 Tax=Tothia fuscella TaxID=1048955 RepID=A0A9P4P3U6_9PEZI|nr:hypothetical protein EJ08DRAFT_1892 [Tothia fuscella]
MDDILDRLNPMGSRSKHVATKALDPSEVQSILATSYRITKRKIKAKRPQLSNMGLRTVTIKIGPKAKAFNIHENLLTQCSPYFRKAFKGPWKEAQAREMTLEDVTERTFDMVLRWIYSQKLCRPQATRDAHEVTIKQTKFNPAALEESTHPQARYTTVTIPLADFNEATMGKHTDKDIISQLYRRGQALAYDFEYPEYFHFDDLLDLAIFSNFYDFPQLHTDVIKLWQQQSELKGGKTVHCNFATVLRAYEALPEDSSMCRLIAHTYAALWQIGSDEDIKFIREEAPKAFVTEVMLAKSQDRLADYDPCDVLPDYVSNPCLFHDHLETEDGICVASGENASKIRPPPHYTSCSDASRVNAPPYPVSHPYIYDSSSDDSHHLDDSDDIDSEFEREIEAHASHF